MKYKWHTHENDKTCHECQRLDGQTLDKIEERIARSFIETYRKNRGMDPCRCHTTVVEQVEVRRVVKTPAQYREAKQRAYEAIYGIDYARKSSAQEYSASCKATDRICDDLKYAISIMKGL